jgi:cadmium resistance protein CadD (predicted permease)
MTRNEGTLDRVLRIALGIALLALVWVGPRSMLGLLGLIPLATGVFGFCPLYSLLGVSTCRRRA